MDSASAIRVINYLKNYCEKNSVGLFIVGSVAYMGALDDHAIFPNCDDLDCIFIYNDLAQLADCPFFKSKNLFPLATKLLKNGEVHMFSSKSIIEGLQLSADFISLDYFKELADEHFKPQNSFRIKLTDSLEKITNEYRSFNGSRYIYYKEAKSYADCFLYKLPIRIWADGEYYTGALYNKFIHNPATIVDLVGMDTTHKLLLGRYRGHFLRCAADNPSASLMSAMLFKDRFSPQTKTFLYKLVFPQEVWGL